MEAVLEPVATILVAVVGLVVGSFLNVCIHRLPSGESVVAPRSRCPSCGAPVLAWQNVPVLSWIALRGRCASCRAPISWRYPAVEALTAVALVLLWRVLGPSAAFAVAAPFTLAMIVLFFTDWDHHILPDAVTLTGFAVGVATSLWNPFLGEPGWPRVVASITGAALGAGPLWLVGALYKRIRGIEGMGFGDVKLMAFVGAVTGPPGVAATLFFGTIVGALVGIALIPLRGKSLKAELPFGCFLAPASLFALLWGRSAIEAYRAAFGVGP
ncbi:MAG TPA: prepilin peptidase [Candidatus Polarisedimenticolaceae bacterium]|nr:prepilin peptidase [Candidatus Polarisedimenticolaceae bacterium]